jgi:hypothetical protein
LGPWFFAASPHGAGCCPELDCAWEMLIPKTNRVIKNAPSGIKPLNADFIAVCFPRGTGIMKELILSHFSIYSDRENIKNFFVSPSFSLPVFR